VERTKGTKPMTKQQAIFEIAELASSLVHHTQTSPTELFDWCEKLQDEVEEQDPGLRGSDWSSDYKKAEAWLAEAYKSKEVKTLWEQGLL
jgi:hypothetical protein